MSASKQGKAESKVRTVRPDDVKAWEALQDSNPDMLSRLVSGVVAALARPLPGLDMGDVAALAVCGVARQYAATGNPARAVARAIRAARTEVANARHDAESLDNPSDETRAMLARWEAPADRVGSVDSVGSLVWGAVETMPEADRDLFRRMAAAWLAHDRETCKRCQRPGSRAGRVTVATVLPHVAGIPTDSAEGKRLRQDCRTALASAEVALTAVAARVAGERAPGWLFWPGMAAVPAMTRTAGNPDRGRVIPGAVPVLAVAWETVLRLPVMAEVSIPESRREAARLRAVAAWETGERARVARIRAAQDGPLPMWTGGPYAGPAPLPADALPARGRVMTGETRETVARGTAVVRVAGPATAPRTVGAVRVAPGLPDVDSVTVTRDGRTVSRAMTEAETAVLDREPETAVLDGETVPVVRERWAGEEYGVTTAPAGDRDRDPRTGMVKAFPAVVSPRKRAGSGATGPTIPARLR